MTDMKFEDMKKINGGEGPQYVGGGPNENGRKDLEQVRKTFEDQKAYFPKSYDGLYDNGEGWSLDPALAKGKKGPTIEFPGKPSVK